MSEHKIKKPTVTVVETPTRYTRLRDALPKGKTAKKLVLILLVLLLVGGGAAALASRQADQQTANEQAAAGKPKKLENQEYDKAISHKQATRDWAGEVKLAEEQADDSLQRQMMLASAYANNKQFDKALAIYEEQAKLGRLTANFYLSAGDIAEQAKQKEAAIKWYEQGIEQAKKEKDVSVMWKENIDMFQQRIAELRK